MSKYKVGDNIVVVNLEIFTPEFRSCVNKTFVVAKTQSILTGDVSDGVFIYTNGKKFYFYDSEVVLEEVYNSPLAKVMREEI